MRNPGLRTVKFDDRVLSEVMRDIDAYMRATVQWLRVDQFDSLYTEPLLVTLAQEPVGIVCVRVRQVGNLELALVAGGVCPYVWEGQYRRVRVQNVPGLTTGTGNTYRFDFVVVS